MKREPPFVGCSDMWWGAPGSTTPATQRVQRARIRNGEGACDDDLGTGCRGAGLVDGGADVVHVVAADLARVQRVGAARHSVRPEIVDAHGDDHGTRAAVDRAGADRPVNSGGDGVGRVGGAGEVVDRHAGDPAELARPVVLRLQATVAAGLAISVNEVLHLRDGDLAHGIAQLIRVGGVGVSEGDDVAVGSCLRRGDARADDTAANCNDRQGSGGECTRQSCPAVVPEAGSSCCEVRPSSCRRSGRLP